MEVRVQGECWASGGGGELAPKLVEHGLIPCIGRNAENGEILMFAFMNEEELRPSIDTGQAHYWSRSRQVLWKIGETSGIRQCLQRFPVDDDQDSVVLGVTLTTAQSGGAAVSGDTPNPTKL